MKKAIQIVSLCLIIIILSSCDQTSIDLENMISEETDNYVAIVWGEKTYIPFCGVDNSQRGVQIGIVDGDVKDQVYKYKKHPTENWIISYYESGEMDSSMLMKEMSVEEIPEGLKSDYEWNN